MLLVVNKQFESHTLIHTGQTKGRDTLAVFSSVSHTDAMILISWHNLHDSTSRFDMNYQYQLEVVLRPAAYEFLCYNQQKE